MKFLYSEVLKDPKVLFSAQGETRTRMRLPSRDFKSLVSAIPPPGRIQLTIINYELRI